MVGFWYHETVVGSATVVCANMFINVWTISLNQRLNGECRFVYFEGLLPSFSSVKTFTMEDLKICILAFDASSIRRVT